jgi:hypothetical protein
MRVSSLMFWALATCLILGVSRDIAALAHANDHSTLARVRFALEGSLLLVTWDLVLVLAICPRTDTLGSEVGFVMGLLAMGCSVASVCFLRHAMYGFA